MRWLASLLLLPVAALAQQTTAKRFTNGLPDDATYFPLGVWLQSPHNAKAYADLGVNLFVGLYDGPTTAQLDALEQAGMRVICEQNAVALAHRGKCIVAWMHGDEPDNAQGRRPFGYAPPILPAQVVADYERMHRADATRPVLLNLGQGAAWDGWHGRGERTNHPEDYPQYVKGCDVVSFDIYPVTHTHRDVKGRLEIVGDGVRRLGGWTRGQKPVWAVVETGHVDNASVRPTPAQLRAEVWIAIASGASGIVYFAHEFEPKFVEAGLLEHADIAAAVKELNAEVLAAAPVLNATRADGAVTAVASGDGRLAVRAHEHGGALHVFAASLSPEPCKATFTLRDDARGPVEVAGRADPVDTLPRDGATFRDDFGGYQIRRYRIALTKPSR